MSATTARPSIWRHAGAWMALPLAGFQLLNVARGFADPVGFAGYFGLAGSAGPGLGFVQVYALRALFLGLFPLLLLWRRDLRTLSWLALVAVVMPLGDAALVAAAQGPGATVARHLVIAAYLVLTGAMLRRAAVQAG